MASIRLIRRRIRTTRNIAQITKAMQMVAASKMKRAQEAAYASKPYAEKIYAATRELAERTSANLHPLLGRGNELGKIFIILISTNKGLAGGLNTNLFRFVYQLYGENKNVDYITIGKKGERFVAKAAKSLIADFSDTVPFEQSVPAVTKLAVDGFVGGIYKDVILIYNTFVSALSQEPTAKKILPIGAMSEGTEGEKEEFSEFLLEPDINEVLEGLLPHYLENQIRSAILEAEASEHSARMIAMKNATDAANDLTIELVLLYNKARQEKITYEIADTVTARMAVGG